MSHQYFKQYGVDLASKGYKIIPLKPASKIPEARNWTEKDYTPAQIKTLIRNGREEHNVGILTEHTPAVDIDVYDEDVAHHMQVFTQELVGETPVRYGQRPKRLLLYRTEQPFTKLTSKRYSDLFGDTHRIEILGQGQQFVAFGLHPTTGKDFEWENLESVSLDDTLPPLQHLPVLTHNRAQAIIDHFEKLAEENGWEVVDNTSSKTVPSVPEEDALLTLEPPLNLSTTKIEKALADVSGAEDYDRWIKVGMALYHQFGGTQEGLDHWHTWSATAPNYDADALDYRYTEKFEATLGRKPITFASILHWAKESREAVYDQTLNTLEEQVKSCTDKKVLLSEVTTAISKTELQDLDFEFMCQIVKRQYKELTGTQAKIADIRKLCTKKTNISTSMPDWAEPWVWLSHEDKFYRHDNQELISRTSFNAKYNRKVLENNSEEQADASRLALDYFNMPVVYEKMYYPQAELFFTYEGREYVNMFNEETFTTPPNKLNSAQKAAEKKLNKHFEAILPDPHDRAVLLDYLTYTVQNPGHKVAWAVLLQGVEGAGKTFLQSFVGTAVGSQNINTVGAATIKTDFSAWGEGQLLTFIEEVRLQGHNRYDVLNALKPFVSNDTVEIHPKGVNPYTVINTTNYVMFTNFKDALPIDDNDRHYAVLFTSFQSKKQLDKFNEENPTHFTDIFNILAEMPEVPAYMLHNRDVSKFKPKSAPPVTKAKNQMVNFSKSEDHLLLEELMHEHAGPDVCDKLLNITALKDHAELEGSSFPEKGRLSFILTKMGFTQLGRVKVGGRKVRFYSKEPNEWGDNLTEISNKVRAYLADHVQDEEEDILK